ncbi:triphosphoribosyl-dephospho-CoA synthetase [Pseudodesulfovibrio sp. JC047]|uniref:triphosphoribosyl-dephospho-CoA synthase n=1 Tax=Pseudodesulfovibrio sp. JC047 TaxID=2683199 RepID=UPI0013D2E053|nr:triphosphoribosyl-dephospho-CoA synthase [Pseudodesulfovibrio sp. JC047]NDV19428.1 triphosphoribosyl-dephospho-CoA synthetase [Pseudodesulfovibrio sp. JC047]
MPSCSDKWIAWAAQIACLFEVLAEKPGNVTRTRDCSGLHFEQFLVSATAIGPAFTAVSTSSVGELIRNSVESTKLLAGVNTNVGILLMMAPLAKAASLDDPANLRNAVRRVLAELTVDDARQAFAAIVKAAPHGMDTVEEGDIRNDNVDMTLLEAMKLAQHRDTLAAQYATDFELVFDVGCAGLKRFLAEGRSLSQAVVQVYLTILATVPDTDIARKTDVETARSISAKAAEVMGLGGVFTEEGREAAERFDQLIRDEKRLYNPGTTADLVAGSLFAFLVSEETPESMAALLARW